MIKVLRNRAYNLLRWSEQYAKTDMVYLTKGGFWLVIGQILTAGSSFVLALLFARLIPKETYGNYRYILSLVGLMATFSLTGLSSAVMQSVARGYYGTFIKAVRVSFKWNSLIFAASLAGAAYYLINQNTTIGYSLLVTALCLPVIKTLETYEPFLSGTKDFKRSALYRGLVDIGTVIATILGVFITQSALILVSINILAQVFLNTFFFRKIYTSIKPEDRLREEKGIITYSKHLSLQNVLSNVAGQLDKVIIFHYLGAIEVAVYTFALAIPQQIKGFVSIVATLAIPKISNRTLSESVKAIPQRYLVSLFFLAPLVLLYIFFAPNIFSFLFPTYQEAVPYTQWIVLILLLMGNTSELVLTIHKAVKEKYLINIFGSVSQILLMIILVHEFRIYGVVWAILISKTLTAMFSYFMARKLSASTHQI